MLFTQFPFFVLLISVFALYYLPVFKNHQVSVLVLGSFIFYAYRFPYLLLLLLSSISINAITSYYIFYGKDNFRKTITAAGVLLNIAILVFFKYAHITGLSLIHIDQSVSLFLISVSVPVGISFFTFHGISMLIDLYRNKSFKVHPELVIKRNFMHHWTNTAFYIAFFPQMIAGPIVKSYYFLPQIQRKYFKDICWEYAVTKLISGYFLKTVVADNLKDITAFISYPYYTYFSSKTLLILLFAHSFQLFADFAGYSLIALGLASIFGYRLIDNFNNPFISTSIAEFWRRWHISLYQWLKDYLFSPLVISLRQYGNMGLVFSVLTTFIIAGAWHGAGWAFIIFGLIHGAAVIIENTVTKHIRIKAFPGIKLLKIVMVFCFVTFVWLLFKLPDLNSDYIYIKRMIYAGGNIDKRYLFFISFYSLPVLLMHIIYYLKSNGYNILKFKYIKPVLYAVMLMAILSNKGSSGNFIYFQF